ncbi:hypothetical protein [Thomasclavelia cocleata]|uniref:hypothetical protein n=1 Tax=Thomasclavelia cocleata TaxID=69824 RepID=UPI00256F58A3|nr:hypothetical protein [Thomasclavelia cocleata]
MVNMDTLNQKVDRKTRQLTEKAMAKLDTQIKTLEEGGVKFEKLFNNDAIKYDVLGKNFFTYKFRGDDSSQLRVLYRFVRNDESFVVECHKVEVKRRSGKGYIKEFESYAANF